MAAKLGLRWSPQQISNRLQTEYPDDPEMRVSHETIYASIYRHGLQASPPSRPVFAPGAGDAGHVVEDAARSAARTRT